MWLSLWSCQHPGNQGPLSVTHFTDEETEAQWSQRHYSGPHMVSEGQCQASHPECTKPPPCVPGARHPWVPIQSVAFKAKSTWPSFLGITHRSGLDGMGRLLLCLCQLLPCRSFFLLNFTLVRLMELRSQATIMMALTPQTSGRLLHLKALSRLIAWLPSQVLLPPGTRSQPWSLAPSLP